MQAVRQPSYRTDHRRKQSAYDLPRLLLLALALTLSACASAPPGGSQATPQSLVLTKTLQIPAGEAHTFFQAGRQTARVDHYLPYCEFVVNDIAEQIQTVEPGPLAIQQVTRTRLRDDVTGIPAIGPGSLMSCDMFWWETRLRLHSAEQQNVRMLACREAFRGCGYGAYLGREQIQDILGDSFQVE